MDVSGDKIVDALRSSLRENERLRTVTRQLTAAAQEPIAIVSMSCRFPGGVESPEDLWRLVESEVDAVADIPADRGWDVDGLYDPDPGKHGKLSTKQGGFLTGAAEFDPAFFGISPREALAMDPQQRLLLETAWEAFERAAIDPLSMRGQQVGVYAGAAYQGYGPSIEDAPEHVQGHLVTGISTSVISGRIAYALGLEGPAVTVDTACSSSLVALHLACQALRSGECTLALAGGVTVIGSPMSLVGFSRQGALAPDGRCKAFGAEADGMGPAEGVGLLLLERLSVARRNGHRVLALVRGTAVNQDGASNGLSAPSGPAQQRVIRQALANARLSAADVDVVEAHGTGTALGDPIEAEALLATYGQERSEPLWLGSLKSNIGHSQTAAGVGGVIKMVQALRNNVLPRTLHADEPSEHVDWSSGRVELLRQARPWPDAERPRRAAVSSFGVSGTNAHAILEQAPPVKNPEPAPHSTGPVPWVLSARNVTALRAQAERLLGYVTDNPELDPAGVGHALAVTRTGFEHRAAVIGASRADFVAGLTALAAGTTADTVSGRVGGGGRVAFVFPGQGSQWPLMARELLDTAPVFAEQARACDAALREFTEWSVLDVLSGAPGAPELSRVDVVQPVLFTVMVSLAALWESVGVRPSGVVGHSQGEIAAAYVCGALSLADAARVVALRSRAWWELRGKGGMLSVGLPADQVRVRLERWDALLALAAVNSPSTVAVSGDPLALDELAAELTAEGIHSRRVPGVDTAGHSPQVDVLRAQLLRDLAPVRPQAARIPFYSTVTGELLDTTTMDAGYWYRNMRDPVEFESATRALLAAGADKFIEVSPHPLLRIPLFETFESAGAVAVSMGTLTRDVGGLRRFMGAAAELYAHGGSLDWAAVFGGRPATATDLPTYPFQREHLWLDHRAPVTAIAPQDDWRYRISWRHLPPGRRGALTGVWLVVLPDGQDPHGIGAALAGHTEIVTVSIGRAQVDPEPLAARLEQALAAAPAPIAGVLSLLATDDTPYSDRSAFPVGVVATLSLLRALGARRVEAPLWTVTSGAVSVGGADPLRRPLQAQAWGLGRIAALEYPHRWGGLVDLPETPDPRSVDQLVAVLAGLDGEDEVALRPAGIFGRRLVRPTPQPTPEQPWRPSGTVLVTGGTGGLGAHLARWLVAGGAEHVVLTGRRGPRTPGVAELCAELAEQGARVTVEACDVADRAALERLLAALPGLTAVFHAAGVVDDSVLEAVTPERADGVVRSKVDGARHLHELTAGLDLSAFVLFSSFGGVLGSPGQGTYAAANAYLDALARYRADRGLPATAVAWAVWGGDGGVTAELAAELAADGVPAMRPDLAIAALQRALDLGETCSAVANIAWDRLVRTVTAVRPGIVLRDLPDALPYLKAEQVAVQQDSPTGQLAALDATARARAVTALVRTAVADALGYDDADAIDFRRPFRDLGFDSLTAVNLRNQLVTATGLRLPVTLVFDYPTAAELTEQLLTEFGDGPSVGHTVVGHVDVSDDPIAIVAMACRFPGGVGSPEQLWDLVAAGVDAVGPFPSDRNWDIDGRFDPDPDRPGTYYTTGGSFLYEAADFDPAFFGISPREALTIDPQQRLLLETAWEAFERAGIDPMPLRGSATGVFVGASYTDYGARLRGAPGEYEGYLINGSAGSVASGRVSYTFGFEGPAVTVDTACSSSLVALHLAAQSLRNGESSLALAGGVVVMSTMDTFVEFSRQRLLAEDGRCKAFGAGADGAGWGEGVGLVLLERLSDARRNGHEVLAVVAGSAVNQDGASNGLTAPNGPSQQRVIRQALANANLTAAQVDLVEAHGTGTTLGDPIEAQAILATYGQDRPADRPVRLGTVKSNIGHTQAAAGIAGVIKSVMAIRNQLLPRTLHADTPSPDVDWTAGTLALLTDNVSWAAAGPRRAGISSFGVSGTNAHVIVAEAEPGAVTESGARLSPVPWTLSARDPAALRAQAARLLAFVDESTALDITDVGFSLATGRSAFEHRAVLVGGDVATLRNGLAELAAGQTPLSGAARMNGKTAVLFPGQGAQRLGMGRELYAQFPVFAAAFDAVLAQADMPLRGVLWGEDESVLERTEFAQVGLFAVEVALFRLLESWGVRADFLIGHSVGELAAAHVAGVWSLADAVRVVTARGRLMQGLAGGGAMVAIEASETEVVAALPAGVEIAAVNGPRSMVVSGDEDAVVAFAARMAESGSRVKRLAVSHAFHSRRMEPMLAEFEQVLTGVSYSDPTMPVVSNLTGSVDADLTSPKYWVRQVRDSVRFGAGLSFLVEQGVSRFVEVGPGAALSGLVDTGKAIPTLRADRPEVDAVLTALGQLHVDGGAVDWSAVFTGARRVDLPTYAFQHQRYWLDAPEVSNAAAVGLRTTEHPLLGASLSMPGTGGCVLTSRISLRTHPWLVDHRFAAAPLFPGAALLELAAAAGAQVGCDLVDELTMQAPLPLPERDAVVLHVTVGEATETGVRSVAVHSRPEHSDEWTCHALGTLADRGDRTGLVELTDWPPTGAQSMDLSDIYDLDDTGFAYGPAFQGLRAVWRTEDAVYAEVALPVALQADARRFGLHPALLDAACQIIGFAPLEQLGMPFAWQGYTLNLSGMSALRVRLTTDGANTARVDLADQTGHPVGAIAALSLRPAAIAAGSGDSLYRLDWRAADFAEPAAAEIPDYAALDPADRAPEIVQVYFPAGRPSLDEAPAAVRSALHRALELVRIWLTDPRFAAATLVFVTNNGVALSDEAAPDLANAAVWGLVRGAQTENPGRFVLVDVDDREQSAVAVRAAAVADEPHVAVRRGDALVARLVRVPATERTGGWDPDGTVLVTGATGTLGSRVARHLARTHGVRHLVLVGRRGLSAPGAAELVADLTDLGVDARFVACDITDSAAVAALIADIPTEHPLTAVVHTAGVLADGVVEELTEDRLDQVLRPKLDAVLHLHQHTRELNLSAFVLYSSLAGTFGGMGQANYAAANAFLDAFAQYRRDRGLAGQSLAWGLWAERSGMTGKLDDADLRRIGRAGIVAFSAAEGLAMFDAATGSDEPVLVPTRLDLAALRRHPDRAPVLLRDLIGSNRVRGQAASGGADAVDTLRRDLAGRDEAEQTRVLLGVVRRQAGLVLGHGDLSRIEPDRGLLDLGFDSLTAVELRNGLAAATGLRLPATLLFDYPTPVAMAGYLREQFAFDAPAEISGVADWEAALLAGELGERDRAVLATRLRNLLAQLDGPSSGVPERIDTADDAEIFDFIDNDLGVV
ncbi:SDR family NAD(P)-dependent oxidoreductase [Nocardia sp. A7]|uniref:SDR family NAD(P)-dependent oxidoreductase n=1 Tax=Nocardia sp. A7 TaxID=2789274 RepID=UPI00397BBCDA